MLGPRIRLLGGELAQLHSGLIEVAELEQRHPFLAPRLAVLGVVLQRLVGSGQCVAGPAQVVERHRLQQIELLEQRLVAPFLRPRHRAVDVLQRQLQIVAAAQAADVQIGHRTEHFGIVGIERQRARIGGARLFDVP